MARTIRVEPVRGCRWSNLALTHGGPSKLLAIGRRSRPRARWVEEGARGWRAKEVGAWKREHAINATAGALARTAINPHKDAFACGPREYSFSTDAQFSYTRARARARPRTRKVHAVGCIKDIRYMHRRFVVDSPFARRERATVIKPCD